MSGYTKGPWKTHVDGHNIQIVSDASPYWIARMVGSQSCGMTTEEREANARLIAFAPEMLEVLSGIANADWRKWDDNLNQPEEFVAWAKSVAGYISAKALGVIQRESFGHSFSHTSEEKQ